TTRTRVAVGITDVLAHGRRRPPQTAVGTGDARLQLSAFAVTLARTRAFVVAHQALRCRAARSRRAVRFCPIEATIGVRDTLANHSTLAALLSHGTRIVTLTARRR